MKGGVGGVNPGGEVWTFLFDFVVLIPESSLVDSNVTVLCIGSAGVTSTVRSGMLVERGFTEDNLCFCLIIV